MSRAVLLPAVLAFGLSAGACSSDAGDSITVFAAASLADSFEDLAAAYEESHPSAHILLNFAGSQVLAGQIVEGAPADVFASANPTQMDNVAGAGLTASSPQIFASNSLAIAVESGNPLGIASLDDLTRDGVVVIIAAPEVPIGSYTAAALETAGVTLHPASLEANVKAVVSKVALGEADAGIVYLTDVAVAGTVDAVPIPAVHNIGARYLIAVIGEAGVEHDGTGFVDFVLSPAGSEILRHHGFGPP